MEICEGEIIRLAYQETMAGYSSDTIMYGLICMDRSRIFIAEEED
jgi:hypothetical protein